jgi:hypothetical protein
VIHLSIETSVEIIDALVSALEDELEIAVQKTAFKVQALARYYAPVDTGFLRNSIQVVLFTGGGAAGADGTQGVLLGMMPTNRLEAIVYVGAEYGAFVEYGHFATRGNKIRVGRRAGRIGMKLEDGRIVTYVPGYLYMTTAVAETRPYFNQKVTEAVAKARKSA